MQTIPCQEEENEVKKYHKKIKALERRRVHSVGVHKVFIPVNRR